MSSKNNYKPWSGLAYQTPFTLKLYTTEADRVVRAWQYIYANGCKGSRSAF